MMRRILVLLYLMLFSVCSIQAQVFTDSNLPIVIISTDNGVSIPDEPGVLGNMKIIFRGDGLRNYVTDQDSAAFLDYDGRIDIETRGSYSQVFPKKAYGFSTKMPDGITNNNVSILGMPSENDWVLNGLSSDPSLVRDYISYNLSARLGNYASRTEYCEVVLNGDYVGLYILQEKIKPDKDRVNILKIEPNDISLPELTGGYITKTDKTTGGDPIAWTMSSYIGTGDNKFIHDWPDPDVVTITQNDYIKSVFQNLKTTAASNNTSLVNGFPSIIDIPSFVDFMLINELASNADAYTYSTYFHKDRDGKLRAGPVWDLNLTYGNDLFQLGFDRSKPDVWQFYNGNNEGPKFWRDLFNNTLFKCYLSRRWHETSLSGNPLHLNSLTAFIDSTVSYISEATLREDVRWGTIGNHAYHISQLKSFLNARVSWINSNIGPYSNCSPALPPLVISKIHYHPATSVNFPVSEDLEFLEITNMGSTIIDLSGVYFRGPGFVFQFPPASTLMPGAWLRLASNATTYQNKHGIAPFGQFTRNLSNADQDLILADGYGNVIDQVHYYDDPPWPDADGNGKFLQLIDGLLDNSLASSWVAVDEFTLSINTVAGKPGLTVYPNPVRSKVNINATNHMEIIEIYSIQGEILATFTPNANEFMLDMSIYPAGVYFIKVSNAEYSIYRKIIRN